MADEFDSYRNEAVRESNGQAISRSLTSGRTGRATIPQDFRERQQTAIEQDREFRRKLAEDKFAVEKDARQIAKEAALARAAEVKFNLLSKKVEVREKMETLQHSTAALEELNGLDYKAGDLPNRLADIYRRNPRALDNAGVKSLADRMLGMHENYLKDFRTDAQKEADSKAAAAEVEAAKKLGFVPTDVTTKTGDVTTKLAPPEAAKPAAAGNNGTETIKVDDNTTIRRPLPAPGSPEEMKRLKAEHDLLEAKVTSKSGNMVFDKASPKDVEKLNGLKAQLGYRLIGAPETTASTAPAAPVATPAVTVGNPNGTAAPAAPVAAAPATPKLSPLTDDVAKAARAAIAAGKDAAAVAKRLQENGYDPAGL